MKLNPEEVIILIKKLKEGWYLGFFNRILNKRNS
jgi:hypothetical protein